MSIVKQRYNEYMTERVDLFIELVMLIGGRGDLLKRYNETEIALKYLILKRDNTLESEIEHIRKELNSIADSLESERVKIWELRKKQYELTKLKKYNWYRGYYWECSTFYLTTQETNEVKDHIKANYHERKPFPYAIETGRCDRYQV